MRLAPPIAALLALSVSTALGTAYAQPAPAQPAPAQPAPAPNPGAAPGTAPSSVAPPAEVPMVDDPMLRPLPEAPHTLTSWQEAVRMVKAQSTSLRTARAQVEQARGQARQALSHALPTLTAGASVTRNLLLGSRTNVNFDPATGAVTSNQQTVPDPATSWTTGAELDVPVFAPRAWYDAKTARMAVGVAELSTTETQRQILAALADAIVTVITSERLLEVSRVSLNSALSTLDLNKRRNALGAASSLDVLRAQQDVEQSRAQVVTTAETVRQDREALGLALGSPEPWSVTPNLSLDGLAADAEHSCHPEQTVDTRSDVRAAQGQVNIAERNIASTDWSFWPTVVARSNFDYRPLLRTSPNNEHFTWTISGVLSWTLYDGGLRYGQRQEAIGQRDQAQEALTGAKRTATVQVVQARRSIQVAESNLDVSRRARDVAAESARLARIAFVNGSGTSFDLVDTARQLRAAELDLAIKEFQVVRAKITALLALSTCNL